VSKQDASVQFGSLGVMSSWGIHSRNLKFIHTFHVFELELADSISLFSLLHSKFRIHSRNLKFFLPFIYIYKYI
jgi:hypothetical protein